MRGECMSCVLLGFDSHTEEVGSNHMRYSGMLLAVLYNDVALKSLAEGGDNKCSRFASNLA